MLIILRIYYLATTPMKLNGFILLNGQAIPHAIAMVRASDKKSPREAVEFILELLKVSISLLMFT